MTNGHRDLLAAHDWANTPLGPIASWPRALRGYVSMILEMPTPAIIFWGPDQTQIYNEGYAAIMGPRHPRYFAAPYRECWPETYPLIYPWMLDVLERGQVKQVENSLFTLTRHGFTEESYFTFTFSPLRDDDDKIAGILQPVVETTGFVLAERRAATLREVAGRSAGGASPVLALGENPKDIAFALLYVADAAGELELTGEVGLGSGARLRAADVARIARGVLASGHAADIAKLDAILDGTHIGHWAEPTRSAMALPVRAAADEPALGVLILGLSPRLHFDEPYRSFVSSAAQVIGTSIATARSAAAEALSLARERAAREESELHRQHLMALLTQAPTPITLLRGPTHVIELANARALQLWGRTAEEVLGRPLLEGLSELRGQVFDDLLKSVYTSGIAHVSDTPIVAKLQRAGSAELEDRHLTFVYSPLRLASGAIDGILVIAFDVTEQVQAKEQVEGLRRAAESANMAKDEFLAILGHELRNPLAPILTAVQLLRMRGNDALQKEIDVIDRQALHLVRLVDDLLDVSRITRSKVELRKERIELARVVDRAVEMVTPLLEERQHDLNVHVARAGLSVEVDPSRLAQVLANLLSNAAKYTEQHGTISLTASATDGHVTVHVADTGIGIDPEMLARVFDIFAQAPQALDRARGGLGLGLTIVKRLVELHGGRVEARSAGRGHGSEFVVTLPAASAIVGQSPSGRNAPARDENQLGRRILIVDDNKDSADLLAEWLTMRGHITRVAYDGPSALSANPDFAPEVGLLDIGLPVMDGYELAQRLRERHGSRLRLVAITGYGQPSDRARTKEAGFDAHIAKPVALDKLEVTLRDLISGL